MDELKAEALNNPKPGHLWFLKTPNDEKFYLIVLEVGPTNLRYCATRDEMDRWALHISDYITKNEYRKCMADKNYVIGNYRDLDTVMQYLELKNAVPVAVAPAPPPPMPPAGWYQAYPLVPDGGFPGVNQAALLNHGLAQAQAAQPVAPGRPVNPQDYVPQEVVDPMVDAWIRRARQR